MATVNGTAGSNNLRGSWANDLIDGKGGADTMSGGGGIDTYIVDHVDDVVRETPTHRITNNTAIQVASISGSTLGNGHSGGFALAISQNGDGIAFYTEADNLVPEDDNLYDEFVLRVMSSGELFLLETASENQPITQPGGVDDYSSIRFSSNNRYVVFASTSPDLVPADDATDEDIFVKNLETGEISIVSLPSGGSGDYHAWAPDISGTGRYVVFSATDNLVNANDDNGVQNSDVFWRNTQTGELRLVSGTFNGGTQGNSDSDAASVTDNGRYVVFETTASNLDSAGDPDTNGKMDIYIRDMQIDGINGTLRLTRSHNGGAANGPSGNPQITPNGRYMVFESSADNLIQGQDNDGYNIYRMDLFTDELELVRVNTTSSGVRVESSAFHPQITPDGRYVVFESTSMDLVAVNGDSDLYTKIFVKDLVTGQIEMVSRTASGGPLTDYDAYAPQISDDGRFIAFVTREDLNGQDSGTNSDVYRVPNPLYSPGDEVRASVSYALPADVENLVLTGASAISGTGNSLANVITGNGENNILDGRGGNDKLNGGDGKDTLKGIGGADVLTGGAGGDRFDFDDVSDSGPGASKRDQITDFVRAQGDKIDLSGIDANGAGTGNGKFSFIGTANFSGNATGKLRFDPGTDLLYGSTDADTAAEFSILLTGVNSMTGAAFIL